VPGAAKVDPVSGYATVSAGPVTLSGFVFSSAGGSGSAIGLTCTATSFCAKGTVGASSTYNAWATSGLNVNQSQSGASGSTKTLVLTGSTLSVTYQNNAGSSLEFQLWDGSNYWCYYLPAGTGTTTASIPFSSLNTQCWNGSGTAFVSGTPIVSVQINVPGNGRTPVSFDYCFLGLTVQ
jgi:hypothetical protein